MRASSSKVSTRVKKKNISRRYIMSRENQSNLKHYDDYQLLLIYTFGSRHAKDDE